MHEEKQHKRIQLPVEKRSENIQKIELRMDPGENEDG
jgi:hypothetical protein